MINTLVILLLISSVFYALFKQKIDLFQAYIFFIPFAQLSVEFGVVIYLYQIVLIMLVLKLLSGGRIVFQNHTLYIFLFYAVITTLVVSVFFLDTYMFMDGGYLRKEGRFIAQIIVFVMSFLAAFVAHYYAGKTLSFMKYFKTYVISVLVLSQLGIFQGIMFSLLGYDIFPLSIVEANNIDGERPPGIWGRTLGLYIFRISSFAGEPKSLAIHATAAYFIIDCFNRQNIRLFRQDSKIKLLFLFTLIWTLSSGGYVLFVILLVFLGAIRFFDRTHSRLRMGSVLLGTFVGSIVLSLAYVFYDFLYIVLNDRFLGRNLFQEDYDYVVQTFLFNNLEWIIFGSGLGNIHNLSFMYIPVEKEYYMAGNIFLAKSGYLRLISELGLIGFTLFLIFNSVVLFRCGRLIRSMKDSVYTSHLKAMRTVLLVALIMYLARGYAFNVYIMLFSIVNTIVYSQKWRRLGGNI